MLYVGLVNCYCGFLEFLCVKSGTLKCLVAGNLYNLNDQKYVICSSVHFLDQISQRSVPLTPWVRNNLSNNPSIFCLVFYSYSHAQSNVKLSPLSLLSSLHNVPRVIQLFLKLSILQKSFFHSN